MKKLIRKKKKMKMRMIVLTQMARSGKMIGMNFTLIVTDVCA